MAPRRILIDGTSARGGGGFTYLANVLPRLGALAPDTHYRVLLRNARLAGSLPAVSNAELINLPEAGIATRLRHTFFDVPRRVGEWHPDLYFSVSEMAPLRLPCPIIASFRNPNVFTPLRQGWPIGQRTRLATLRWLARLAARTCDRIVFVSEDSARWIGDSLGLAESHRAVIHHGIDAAAWSETPPYRGHPRPYILSVSSIYRYKNYVRLIEAYAELAHREANAPDLVIIGDDQDPPYSEQMTAARAATGELAERIHILGEVPYAQVKSHYAGAELFVFPSYLETFGHPLLEAMAVGIPLVAADIPVFREVAGDAAIYANPYDVSSLATAMRTALRTDRSEKLVRRGSLRIREFTWERTAKQLLELFEATLANARVR
jgi:glycosyltransferase involved in cell wall biosynthesis